MKNYLLPFLIILLFVSCSKEDIGIVDASGTSTTSDTTVDNFLFSKAVASVSELIECSSTNEGQIYYISSTDEFRGCNGSEWASVNISQNQTQKESLNFTLLTIPCDTATGVGYINPGYTSYTVSNGNPHYMAKNSKLSKFLIKYVGHTYTSEDPVATTLIPSDLSVDISLSINGIASNDSNLVGNFSSATIIGETFDANFDEVVIPEGSLIGMVVNASCPITNTGTLLTGSWHIYIEYEY